MTDSSSLSRRRFLSASGGGVVLAVLAGCTDDEGEPADGTEAGSGGADDSDPDSGPPSADDLDLREANVVDVAFQRTDDRYAFDVTLRHDDDGEEGYADWWQVERLDGTRLGRRDLLHAHSEQPFTRSETVEVPDGVTCVVVRGHDRTHGYGGVAAVVDLDAEAVRRVDQGPDPSSFDAAGCP